jgi:hypothetical protein
MEPFKPRTKILLIVGASKITFSGNKEMLSHTSQWRRVRANKLSTAFRFKAEGYRPIEIRRYQSTKLQINTNLMSHMIEGIQVTEDHIGIR